MARDKLPVVVLSHPTPPQTSALPFSCFLGLQVLGALGGHSHNCRREQLWDSGPARKRAVSFEVQVLRVQISRYWLASLLCQFRTHLMNN